MSGLMNAEAKNFEAIHHAIVYHDETCRFGGKAVAIAMHPLEIERMGWAPGDTISGCELQADPERATGTFKLVCSRQDEHDQEKAEEATAETPRVGEKVPA